MTRGIGFRVKGFGDLGSGNERGHKAAVQEASISNISISAPIGAQDAERRLFFFPKFFLFHPLH
jgi:hypothetical protein